MTNNPTLPTANKISQPIFSTSDHKILYENSLEYETMMELAFTNNIHTQVLHNGHIAIELLLKAMYAKNNSGTHIRGHDILKILEQPLATNLEPLFEDVKNDNLKETFEMLNSAWSMQYRYERRTTTKTEAEKHLIAYRKVIIWITKKYEK